MTGLSITAASVASLVAKATLVLSVALALAWLARRGSARTLHALWTTTFALLFVLPAVSLLGPSVGRAGPAGPGHRSRIAT